MQRGPPFEVALEDTRAWSPQDFPPAPGKTSPCSLNQNVLPVLFVPGPAVSSTFIIKGLLGLLGLKGPF